MPDPTQPLYGNGDLTFFLMKKLLDQVVIKNKQTTKNLIIQKFSDPNWKDNAALKEFIERVILSATSILSSGFAVQKNHGSFILRNFFRKDATLVFFNSFVPSDHIKIKDLSELFKKIK